MAEKVMAIRLKKLREGSKITKEQMAGYLNVDQSFVTKLENGTSNFNVTLIDKICSLFGCTEDYLLRASEEHIPLNFAFDSKGIESEDLECIAVMNRIAMNLRYMKQKEMSNL